jgi:hypothetical protein
MDWKRELDALIAQTYAFVQSVTNKREENAGLESRVQPAMPLQPPPEAGAIPVEAAPAQPAIQQQSPVQAAIKAVEAPRGIELPILQSEVKEEIEARIASFRAHQDRFNRERAEYFNATLARLRAALEQGLRPRSLQIDQDGEPLSRRSSPRPAANVAETLAGSRSSENGRGPA